MITRPCGDHEEIIIRPFSAWTAIAHCSRTLQSHPIPGRDVRPMQDSYSRRALLKSSPAACFTAWCHGKPLVTEREGGAGATGENNSMHSRKVSLCSICRMLNASICFGGGWGGGLRCMPVALLKKAAHFHEHAKGVCSGRVRLPIRPCSEVSEIHKVPNYCCALHGSPHRSTPTTALSLILHRSLLSAVPETKRFYPLLHQ